jgi:hypothetical protein
LEDMDRQSFRDALDFAEAIKQQNMISQGEIL